METLGRGAQRLDKGRICILVAEWIHFTLFGIIFPTIKLKVYTFGGLLTQQLRYVGQGCRKCGLIYDTNNWMRALLC